MRRLLLAAVLGLTVGCDSPTVAENIDIFTCAWLPWWMADCIDPAVHNRALSILSDGIVRAQVQCSVNYTSYSTRTLSTPELVSYGYRSFVFSATLFQDGSAFVNTNAGSLQFTGFLSRRDPRVADFSVVPHLAGTAEISLSGGELIVTSMEASYTRPDSSSFYTTVYELLQHSTDLDSEYCTGFNLEAFE